MVDSIHHGYSYEEGICFVYMMTEPVNLGTCHSSVLIFVWLTVRAVMKHLHGPSQSVEIAVLQSR